MTDLCAALRRVLADTFMFYLEAHFFHWNVEGPTFSQLHELFGDIYEDAFEAADDIAEKIRTLGEFAPMTPEELVSGATMNILPVLEANAMVAKLAEDNVLVLRSLSDAQECAGACGYPEVANFLQERMDRHDKWGWMLKATLGAAESGVTLRQFTLYDYGRS